jgi:hypothetical protein
MIAMFIVFTIGGQNFERHEPQRVGNVRRSE